MSSILSETWGEVEVRTECDVPTSSSCNAQLTESCESYIWRPCSDLTDEVPPNFSLQMICTTGNDGLRRFRPPSGKVFPILASAGGIAVLKKEGLLTRREAGTYRMTSLLFQLGGRLREHLGRTFRRVKDLYVPGSSSLQGRSHILPEGLWAPSTSGDVPLTPNRLYELGQQALEHQPEANHDDEIVIRTGLTELSKSQPFDVNELSAQEAIPIVRLGLYDLGPAEAGIPQEVQDEVMERFFDSLEKHLDLATEEFNNWFFEKLDNIVKQVSRRNRSIGSVDRKIVRQIILERVFDCYRLMADAVEFQMREFANALPTPLNAEERAMFESLYFRQPWLGNLSMSLIEDRSEQFGPLGAELLSEPTSPRLQGSLLRFLSIHGEMVRNKRRSDAEHKRRQRTGFQEVLTSDFSEQSRSQSCEFQIVASEQRDLCNATCPCNSRVDWRAEDIDRDEQSQTLTWIDRCGKCGHEAPVSISYEDMKRLLRADSADE